MPIRQISDSEKEIVNNQQKDKNGNLICFISGEIIGPNDEVEYDHTTAFAAEGATDIVNVKAVLKNIIEEKKTKLYLMLENYFN